METDVCPDADIYRVISASWKLIKDLEEIPKTLEYSDEDMYTKEKNRKGLVRLIEEQLEGTLKGTPGGF